MWAACAALLMIGIWYGLLRNTPGLARVVRLEAAVWGDGQTVPREGQALAPGHVRLRGGFAELRLSSGVRLILEGPADLELVGRNRCFLHRGKAVARLPGEAIGFVLDGPRGRLVDLGTEFGVSVGGAGETEAHVLKGFVEATPQGDRAATRLRQNEALRFDDHASRRMAADGGAFLTELPPQPSQPVGVLHWTFDEGVGNLSRNLGQGLGPVEPHARLCAFLPGEPGPEWVDGRFGKALRFDGRQAYVEANFSGIPGGEARTVAFWVRVPKDFTTNQGYAILNWGTLVEPGNAWQISINPEAAHGPLGRLRVGLHRAPAVGVTDLRDDRWHHVAVVMYGGAGANLSTHVLLYLDGQLEPASRKAVQEVRTDTRSQAAHNLWIGRNLAYSEAGRPVPGGPFFRGVLDEIFIFDAALSQGQIAELMKLNRPPAGLSLRPGPLAGLSSHP
jgi:hypothetical protein